MWTTLLCLRRMDSTNLWFPSKVSATELFPIRRALKERGLSVMERSFPASAGRGCRYKPIARSTSYNGTVMARSTSGCFRTTYTTRTCLVPVVPTNSNPFPTIPYVRDFFAVLEEMDKQIGRVIATIDELNLGKKTLVLFTSDNGPTDWPRKYLTGPPAGFTGPYRGRKWSLFEGGIRMPFIARWTGTIPAGVEDTTSVVSAIDLSPTICRFAGVPVEA